MLEPAREHHYLRCFLRRSGGVPEGGASDHRRPAVPGTGPPLRGGRPGTSADEQLGGCV